MASAQDARAGPKDSSDQNFDYMFKLLIIGNSSVGKTSFLFRYADDSFTSAFVSTVGIDFKVKTVFRNEKRIKLQIWVSGLGRPCAAVRASCAPCQREGPACPSVRLLQGPTASVPRLSTAEGCVSRTAERSLFKVGGRWCLVVRCRFLSRFRKRKCGRCCAGGSSRRAGCAGVAGAAPARLRPLRATLLTHAGRASLFVGRKQPVPDT